MMTRVACRAGGPPRPPSTTRHPSCENAPLSSTTRCRKPIATSARPCPGLGFDIDFRPELTPRQMLRLGVFCGRYLNDCRGEFPKSWFQGAKLARRGPRLFAELFWCGRQPAALHLAKEKLDPPRGSTWLVPVVLPLLYGPAPADRGPAADQSLEGDSPPRPADRAALRAGRPRLPATATAGTPALGL